ncbi:unnamed protein product [Gordionus sp. m RMFG-2023]
MNSIFTQDFVKRLNEISSNKSRQKMMDFIRFLSAKNQNLHSTSPLSYKSSISDLLYLPMTSSKKSSWAYWEEHILLQNWENYLKEQNFDFQSTKYEVLLLRSPKNYNITSDILSYNEDISKTHNNMEDKNICMKFEESVIELRRIFLSFVKLSKLYERLGNGIPRRLNCVYYRMKRKAYANSFKLTGQHTTIKFKFIDYVYNSASHFIHDQKECDKDSMNTAEKSKKYTKFPKGVQLNNLMSTPIKEKGCNTGTLDSDLILPNIDQKYSTSNVQEGYRKNKKLLKVKTKELIEFLNGTNDLGTMNNCDAHNSSALNQASTIKHNTMTVSMKGKQIKEANVNTQIGKSSDITFVKSIDFETNYRPPVKVKKKNSKYTEVIKGEITLDPSIIIDPLSNTTNDKILGNMANQTINKLKTKKRNISKNCDIFHPKIANETNDTIIQIYPKSSSIPDTMLPINAKMNTISVLKTQDSKFIKSSHQNKSTNLKDSKLRCQHRLITLLNCVVSMYDPQEGEYNKNKIAWDVMDQILFSRLYRSKKIYTDLIKKYVPNHDQLDFRAIVLALKNIVLPDFDDSLPIASNLTRRDIINLKIFHQKSNNYIVESIEGDINGTTVESVTLTRMPNRFLPHIPTHNNNNTSSLYKSDVIDRSKKILYQVDYKTTLKARKELVLYLNRLIKDKEPQSEYIDREKERKKINKVRKIKVHRDVDWDTLTKEINKKLGSNFTITEMIRKYRNLRPYVPEYKEIGFVKTIIKLKERYIPIVTKSIKLKERSLGSSRATDIGNGPPDILKDQFISINPRKKQKKSLINKNISNLPDDCTILDSKSNDEEITQIRNIHQKNKKLKTSDNSESLKSRKRQNKTALTNEDKPLSNINMYDTEKNPIEEIYPEKLKKIKKKKNCLADLEIPKKIEKREISQLQKSSNFSSNDKSASPVDKFRQHLKELVQEAYVNEINIAAATTIQSMDLNEQENKQLSQMTLKEKKRKNKKSNRLDGDHTDIGTIRPSKKKKRNQNDGINNIINSDEKHRSYEIFRKANLKNTHEPMIKMSDDTSPVPGNEPILDSFGNKKSKYFPNDNHQKKLSRKIKSENDKNSAALSLVTSEDTAIEIVDACPVKNIETSKPSKYSKKDHMLKSDEPMIKKIDRSSRVPRKESILDMSLVKKSKNFPTSKISDDNCMAGKKNISDNDKNSQSLSFVPITFEAIKKIDDDAINRNNDHIRHWNKNRKCENTEEHFKSPLNTIVEANDVNKSNIRPLVLEESSNQNISRVKYRVKNINESLKPYEHSKKDGVLKFINRVTPIDLDSNIQHCLPSQNPLPNHDQQGKIIIESDEINQKQNANYVKSLDLKKNLNRDRRISIDSQANSKKFVNDVVIKASLIISNKRNGLSASSKKHEVHDYHSCGNNKLHELSFNSKCNITSDRQNNKDYRDLSSNSYYNQSRSDHRNNLKRLEGHSEKFRNTSSFNKTLKPDQSCPRNIGLKTNYSEQRDGFYLESNSSFNSETNRYEILQQSFNMPHHCSSNERLRNNLNIAAPYANNNIYEDYNNRNKYHAPLPSRRNFVTMNQWPIESVNQYSGNDVPLPSNINHYSYPYPDNNFPKPLIYKGFPFNSNLQPESNQVPFIPNFGEPNGQNYHTNHHDYLKYDRNIIN